MKQLHLNYLNMIGILMIELASNKKQQQQKQSKPVANLNASNVTKSPLTLSKKVNYFINLTLKKRSFIFKYYS